MSRPVKLNEIPVAPFSLRVTGPLHVSEVERRLGGKAYRIANGAKIDPLATLDPDPCPKCRAQVEWAATSKRAPDGGMVDRYVYARCRGKVTHRWDFRHREAPPTPPAPPTTPPPGSDALVGWIDAQIAALKAQADRLATMRRLAEEIRAGRPTPPAPQPSIH